MRRSVQHSYMMKTHRCRHQHKHHHHRYTPKQHRISLSITLDFCVVYLLYHILYLSRCTVRCFRVDGRVSVFLLLRLCWPYPFSEATFKLLEAKFWRLVKGGMQGCDARLFAMGLEWQRSCGWDSVRVKYRGGGNTLQWRIKGILPISLGCAKWNEGSSGVFKWIMCLYLSCSFLALQAGGIWRQ